MDAAYDALDAATSSYKSSSRDDRHRSHRDDRGHRDYDRSHRDYDRGHRDRGERDYDRGDRGDRRHRDRDYDRGHRDRGDRGERDYDRRRGEDRYGRGDRGDYGGGHGGRDRSPRRGGGRHGDRADRDWNRGGDRDDWRGGGGGGGRGGGGRGRHHSPARSPTPSDAIPLEMRQVEPSLWDIAPPAFEGVSAMEAKMTGMFTYGPGRVAPPLHLGLPTSFVSPLTQKKRIYFAGVQEGMNESRLRKLFNKIVRDAGFEGMEAVSGVEINAEKDYVWVEFVASDLAQAVFNTPGLEFDGTPITPKRPKDFVGIDPALGFMGVSGDPNNKLFVGGLPTTLGSDEVKELLTPFGELRTFNLVKEGNGSVSKGFAFVEFLDPAVTDMAIQGLNGFQLGDRALVVQRAATTGRSATSTGISGTAQFLAQSSILEKADEPAPATRVILMLNMVEADELYDDRDYADILEDIRDECSKFGEVEGVRIPRPVPKSTKWEPSDSAAQTAEKNRRIDQENGVGRVYVMYADTESAVKAMRALGGRQFGGRTILVASCSEEDFLGPAPPPPPSPPPAPEGDDDAPPPPPPGGFAMPPPPA